MSVAFIGENITIMSINTFTYSDYDLQKRQKKTSKVLFFFVDLLTDVTAETEP